MGRVEGLVFISIEVKNEKGDFLKEEEILKYGLTKVKILSVTGKDEEECLTKLKQRLKNL